MHTAFPGVLTAKQNGEWSVSRRYMPCESMARDQKPDQEVKTLAV